MAQLSIPQSLIGALIDIADLGTLDYFPPTERCAHWSLYDAQRQELLCPCAPAANATTEKLFEAAAKILYENFPRYIDSPEEIIPYTSRQELVAALRRGDDELSDEEQTTKVTADSTADVEVEPNPTESAVIEDAEVSASVAPKPAARTGALPRALCRPRGTGSYSGSQRAGRSACGGTRRGDYRRDGSDAGHGCSRSTQARCTETCSTQARCAEACGTGSGAPPPVCSASPRSPTDRRASKSTWRVCAPASRRPKPPPRKPRSR